MVDAGKNPILEAPFSGVAVVVCFLYLIVAAVLRWSVDRSITLGWRVVCALLKGEADFTMDGTVQDSQ
jgi:hypothetical protein